MTETLEKLREELAKSQEMNRRLMDRISHAQEALDKNKNDMQPGIFSYMHTILNKDSQQ